MGILIFILILSFLVLIHELGHFLVAKYFKITIEEFGLGYPPRAVTLFKRWGTVFSLNWIPFGGFVKMEGEDGPAADGAEAPKKTQGSGPFYAKPALARLAVILAGATVNFVFGVLAFSVVFSFKGIPQIVSQDKPLIGVVMPDSPAAQAKIPAGVMITQIKDEQSSLPLSSIEEVVQAVNAREGKNITLVTTGPCQEEKCEPTQVEYPVALRTRANTPNEQGLLGIGFAPIVRFVHYPWYEMPVRGTWYGLQESYYLATSVLQALQQMVLGLVKNLGLPGELMGPVGIAGEFQKSGIVQEGWLSVLHFAGLLSINLAIMNVLPIPALDGGRAVFILLEKVVGKQRVQWWEGHANYFGYALLLVLIIIVSIRDVLKLVVGG